MDQKTTTEATRDCGNSIIQQTRVGVNSNGDPIFEIISAHRDSNKSSGLYVKIEDTGFLRTTIIDVNAIRRVTDFQICKDDVKRLIKFLQENEHKFSNFSTINYEYTDKELIDGENIQKVGRVDRPSRANDINAVRARINNIESAPSVSSRLNPLFTA